MHWSKMDTWMSLRSHRVNKNEKVSYPFGSVTADYCLYKWYINQTDWKYFIGQRLICQGNKIYITVCSWHEYNDPCSFLTDCEVTSFNTQNNAFWFFEKPLQQGLC